MEQIKKISKLTYIKNTNILLFHLIILFIDLNDKTKKAGDLTFKGLNENTMRSKRINIIYFNDYIGN